MESEFGDNSPGNQQSNGQGCGESGEDCDLDRNGRSDPPSNRWNKGPNLGESNGQGNGAGNGENDSASNDLSSLARNSGGHAGNGGGGFRECRTTV